MRKLLQFLLKKPLTWIGNYLAASPKRDTVFHSLSNLYESSKKKRTGRLKVIETDISQSKFIIFSDQHKGNSSWADDFRVCETNYINALQFYHNGGYQFINLGDSEELWKFKVPEILPANKACLATEASFHPGRYYKTFGNHDLIWKNKLDVQMLLKDIFQMPLPVYEGLIIRNKKNNLKLDIFLTHGHQGDLMSDNNFISTWIVAHVWMPMQRYLRININSPSKDFSLRNKHNILMHEWSSIQKDLILITGHTHSPVFASGRYLDHPSNKIQTATPRSLIKPSYFNCGCCCFSDGDITGIEIANGFIRLVKWYDEEVQSKRMVLEEIEIKQLMKDQAKNE